MAHLWLDFLVPKLQFGNSILKALSSWVGKPKLKATKLGLGISKIKKAIWFRSSLNRTSFQLWLTFRIANIPPRISINVSGSGMDSEFPLAETFKAK